MSSLISIINKAAIDNFLSDVYWLESDYLKATSLLERKKNIILQGAPGVGKTFAAKRLALALMGYDGTSTLEKAELEKRIELIQFHQSYSYEDFIMGYRPVQGSAGFERVEGVFYDFCEKARKDWETYTDSLKKAKEMTGKVSVIDEPLKNYYFIIDEINRGNISKIFGETFMLIENDKRDLHNAVKLTYARKVIDATTGQVKLDSSGEIVYDLPRFFIPPNVHIIGMMNTADRSLAMLDYALRRRFSFIKIEPAFSKKGTSFDSSKKSKKFNEVIEKIKILNKYMKNAEQSGLGEEFQIGHSYFCESISNDENNWLEEVIEYEIIPLLEEYWFDDAKKVSDWSNYLMGLTDKIPTSKKTLLETEEQSDDGDDDA